MLQELWIENIALAERLHVPFAPGLNVLTGETGAGKSLVVAALDLVLGARASADLVRRGAEQATITARFEEDGRAGSPAVDAFEDGAILLKRVITAAGKSRAYVNDRPATLRRLRELGSSLADLHGQHEQQNILREETHTGYLDRFSDAMTERAAYRDAYQAHVDARKAKQRFLEASERSANERAFLEHQLSELTAAELVAGEEEALDAERRIAALGGRLSECVGNASAVLGDEEAGVAGRVMRVAQLLGEAVRIDPTLSELARQIDQTGVVLEEADRELRAYLDRLDTDPARLETLERRLDRLAGLKRKYRTDEAGLIARREALGAELASDEDAADALGRLEQAVSESLERLIDSARTLSEKRSEGAVLLGRAVSRELTGLGMTGARFEAALEPVPEGTGVSGAGSRFGPDGAETACFVLAANPGEAEGPLARVASGGEASRVMLALKNVLRGADLVPVAIFDEIDTGIGGLVAEAVGDRLASIAGERQVLVVTHLAVIAGRASHHIRLAKATEGGRTTTTAAVIRGVAREAELSRMLAGASGGESARATARRLIRSSPATGGSARR